MGLAGGGQLQSSCLALCLAYLRGRRHLHTRRYLHTTRRYFNHIVANSIANISSDSNSKNGDYIDEYHQDMLSIDQCIANYCTLGICSFDGYVRALAIDVVGLWTLFMDDDDDDVDVTNCSGHRGKSNSSSSSSSISGGGNGQGGDEGACRRRISLLASLLFHMLDKVMSSVEMNEHQHPQQVTNGIYATSSLPFFLTTTSLSTPSSPSTIARMKTHISHLAASLLLHCVCLDQDPFVRSSAWKVIAAAAATATGTAAVSAAAAASVSAASVSVSAAVANAAATASATSLRIITLWQALVRTAASHTKAQHGHSCQCACDQESSYSHSALSCPSRPLSEFLKFYAGEPLSLDISLLSSDLSSNESYTLSNSVSTASSASPPASSASSSASPALSASSVWSPLSPSLSFPLLAVALVRVGYSEVDPEVCAYGIRAAAAISLAAAVTATATAVTATATAVTATDTATAVTATDATNADVDASAVSSADCGINASASAATSCCDDDAYAMKHHISFILSLAHRAIRAGQHNMASLVKTEAEGVQWVLSHAHVVGGGEEGGAKEEKLGAEHVRDPVSKARDKGVELEDGRVRALMLLCLDSVQMETNVESIQNNNASGQSEDLKTQFRTDTLSVKCLRLCLEGPPISLEQGLETTTDCY